MKVFFFGRYNPGEILTGPEKVAKRVFSEFTKDNKAVFIEYFFDGRKYGLLKKLFGKDTVTQYNSSTILRLGLVTLFFFLLKERPSTIHIITFERFVVAAFLYKIFHKTKIICGFQGIATHENQKYKNVSWLYSAKDKFCEKIIIRYSDALVFLSETSVEVARKYFKINDSKVTILPNGVDEIFHELSNRKRFENSGKLKLVFTGDIKRKEKGYRFLVSALEKSNLDFELFLTSNDKKFHEPNFHGVPLMTTSELAEFLLDKDIFISSSEYEPFSMAAAEAMAEGLVCIATQETGLSRFINNGENGFLFNYGDDKKLLEILNLLFNDRRLLSQISVTSKEVYEVLSWPTITPQYRELYA